MEGLEGAASYDSITRLNDVPTYVSIKRLCTDTMPDLPNPYALPIEDFLCEYSSIIRTAVDAELLLRQERSGKKDIDFLELKMKKIFARQLADTQLDIKQHNGVYSKLHALVGHYDEDYVPQYAKR